jgi:hypothetical protein
MPAAAETVAKKPVTIQPAAAGTSDITQADLKREITRLIADLDSNTLKVRVRAKRRLLELGPPILPFLPEPEQLPNATLRVSVRSIRQALEKRRAIESIRPSRVTLKGRFPLVDVFSEVRRQTGNRLDDAGMDRRSRGHFVDVDYRRATFWEVMDDLSARLSLRFLESENPGTLGIDRADEAAGSQQLKIAYSGAFRIAVLSAATRRLNGTTQYRMLRIRYGISAEPRLRPLFLKQVARNVVARTQAGKPLASFNPEATYELALGEGGWQVIVQSDYKVAADSIPVAVQFAGKLTMQTAADLESFEFQKVTKARGVSRRHGGVTVTLRNADQQEGAEGTRSARIEIAVGYDLGGPAFESHRTWMFHNDAYLKDDNGVRLDRSAGFSTRRQADGAVAIEYNFEQLVQPLSAYRFVYTAPTMIINVPIRFEVDNLPVGGG